MAEIAAEMGWPVWLNDHLVSAGIMASARLISRDQVTFREFGGYERTLARLNALQPLEGFIWKQYSPASRSHCSVERRYFSETNAGCIDAIRSIIRNWRCKRDLSEVEERLLIADLLAAMNKVANIAGTYGCFLSKWTPQSRNELRLQPRILKALPTDVTVTANEVSTLEVRAQDLVYLDPPYTKRQYASYYHIPETVAFGDEPAVEGVSGLRPWKDKASPFCYKRRALGALTGLIDGLASNRILLSYSAEGHIDIDDLHCELEKHGSVQTIALKNVGRYRPNKVASGANSEVTEYLILVDKEMSQFKKAGAL